MKKLLCFCFVLLLASSAQAQDLWKDLAAFTEKPGVTGYEQALAAEIRARAKAVDWKTDNLGNLYVTLGNGSLHRLIVAPMDEPGYVISAITDDGFLRVQRLPQGAPHPLFEQLHAAQPVLIQTRSGKLLPGVVAGLSTHLQGGRRDAPRVDHLDQVFVDIGAASAAQVRQAGVEVLDPIAIERKLYAMGSGRLTAAAIGDRFGVAALVELLRRVDPAKLSGTLTVAFTAQQWAGSRGLDRLTQHARADEILYVGRLRRPGGGGPGGAQGQAAQQRQETQPPTEPGSGVVFSSAYAENEMTSDLRKTAQDNSIPFTMGPAARLPIVSYTRGPVWPARMTHAGIATSWASTPAEVLDAKDLAQLVRLLEAYVTGSTGASALPAPEPAVLRATLPEKPKVAPAVTEILKELVESYGVSSHETPVRDAVARLLPSWAKPVTDEKGNLILRIPSTGTTKGPRIAFVAHIDEIGYEVTSITDDGRLAVRSLGGGIVEFFAGHAMLVHTADGIRPGVMELPAGWDQANFQWPRGQQGGGLRIDVGARSRAEAEQLGIKVGDSATVPKKYRKLLGKRANGRSFDDRVGSTALVAAAWALGPSLPGRDVTLVWATEEEVGLRGALVAAENMAKGGQAPDYVFAVDTFVSSDSPLESQRYGNAPIGKGFVIRSVDNSNIVPREIVDKLVALAKTSAIPVQFGVTGGGNDGATFIRLGTYDVPIAWPLRYSHSPGEVVDTRDVEALARIVAAISRSW